MKAPNGLRTYVPIVAIVIAGLGLGWKIIDARISGEIRSIRARVEWADGMIDERIKIFESHDREYLERLAGIEQSQKHMQKQLDKIEKKVDDL